MNANVDALSRHGVSVWLDDLSRDRLSDGSLARLVDEMGVVGVTTNPSIFNAALATSQLYGEQVRTLALEGLIADAIARALTTEDVRNACDLLAPVASRTEGVDGRVSIEVDPRLAHDTEGTLAQARELWSEVDRPNLLIKIPATRAGLPAIQTAIAEGISVNVTLIFSLHRYHEVMQAYIAGLERRAAAGQPIDQVHSVASFFVSRVDTAVDALLEADGTPEGLALRGKAAVANARRAYEAYETEFATPRWERLAGMGARRQRPLWASTGVKNPDYSDTLYVTELVAPDTVNTMPESTLRAVADHGVIHGDTVRVKYDDAHEVLAALATEGIDLEVVTETLEYEGVEQFVAAWGELLSSIAAAHHGSATAPQGPPTR